VRGSIRLEGGGTGSIRTLDTHYFALATLIGLIFYHHVLGGKWRDWR